MASHARLLATKTLSSAVQDQRHSEKCTQVDAICVLERSDDQLGRGHEGVVRLEREPPDVSLLRDSEFVAVREQELVPLVRVGPLYSSMIGASGCTSGDVDPTGPIAVIAATIRWAVDPLQADDKRRPIRFGDAQDACLKAS